MWTSSADRLYFADAKEELRGRERRASRQQPAGSAGAAAAAGRWAPAVGGSLPSPAAATALPAPRWWATQ